MNPLTWSFRTAFTLCALLCGGLIAYAYYAQFYQHLDPCPLCILQRIALIALLIVAAIAALHNPARTGRRVYGALAFLAAGVGAAISARHVWLQHLPADKVPECGPGLEYMLDSFPLSSVLKKVFTGSGECAKVDWTFIGLSMPEWTLAWFVIFALGALYYGFRQYRNRADLAGAIGITRPALPTGK